MQLCSYISIYLGSDFFEAIVLIFKKCVSIRRLCWHRIAFSFLIQAPVRTINLLQKHRWMTCDVLYVVNYFFGWRWKKKTTSFILSPPC